MKTPATHWRALADTDGPRVGRQFRQPDLLPRAAPFALVSVIATAGALVPHGDLESWPAYLCSAVLLVLCAGGFLLPWERLPGWSPVLMPLLYTVSVLALILASGAASGIGLVLLVPLIWTVLFHHRWESACVVAAVVVVQAVSSVAQASPDVVIARRIVLWTALGGLIAVATHGLRDRIKSSLVANTALQAEVRELSLARERERIASGLREGVVRKVFDTGLELHGTAAMIGEGPARTRLLHCVAELDDAIQDLRQSVFDLGDSPDAPDAPQPPDTPEDPHGAAGPGPAASEEH
ncbi:MULTISPECIES: hypothetical protein [unclassified Streptomyces]|uniref:hypothetical protein n=1 Tax=unclassified Streptomyces TaxID=2593676 RepID=UPI000DC2C084|nr:MULTISPECIES: hypothetical protein [unclassified Streptomyces]RAJ75294.1 hypothetical protein K377_06469 [Streptomyces sp. PsTaAH-137]